MDCNVLKNYIENRNLILSSFDNDRKSVKELFLSILNGGFKDIYSDNKQINKYLKLFEREIIRIQNYFYINDKRYLDIDYNYKGKNLSKIILDVENQILQIMINYFISKNVNILTLEYDGLKIYTDKYSKHFSINELELNIYKNIRINIELAFKNIEDNFPDFGIRCSTDNIKNKNIIENKIKIVHHDHCLEKNNIIGYICRETKPHFKDNFELLNEKTCFSSEFITKENIYNKELISIENFYSSLKLDDISEEDYNKTLEIYKKLNCKNIKEYLDIYLKLDICLQADIFNVFGNTIWNRFEIDCSKYITSCSLSLDLMLKYTGVKIELIRDISIFDFVNSSILRGVCISSQNIADDKNGIISSCDIASLYPYVMTQNLPIGNYKFVKFFNRNRYLDSEYSCLLNCEVYTTDKVKNNSILKQFPALISKTSIKYDDLSEFQRKL